MRAFYRPGCERPINAVIGVAPGAHPSDAAIRAARSEVARYACRMRRSEGRAVAREFIAWIAWVGWPVK